MKTLARPFVLAVLCLAPTLVEGCGRPSDVDAAQPLALRPVDGGGDRNPVLTPGHLCTRQDADFDEYRYAERIAHCRRKVSSAQKRAVGAAYGLDPSQFHDYQFDHFYSLSLGGSNSSKNLWPLRTPDARRKAQLEQQLYLKLSRGEITQSEALKALEDWR